MNVISQIPAHAAAVSGTDFAGWLSIGANVAEVITGIVAAVAGIRYFWLAHRRRIRLEEHLKQVLEFDSKHGGKCRRVPLRLSAELAMTVREVLEAAYSSKKIIRSLDYDPDTHRATAIFLQYKSDEPQN
jgi:hypothetical protein